ncbi:hypothetical protein L810_1214 [Burkholderia sp. AU4i]|uniref:hypothetical protein n=1 Tax=Burkholderia sp. AU4i TaxID=1335308 RepID=UPI0003988889|nr:hypothetical protein [Burkholderia sp. AU4i]ERJ35956.1 hypothetical protein L810_1214 [Burkholderia sp. AU4i]
MKIFQRIFAVVVGALAVLCASPVDAQFVPGQLLSAQQLNQAFSSVTSNMLPIGGGTLTGPVSGPSASFSTLSATGGATIGSLSVTGSPISISSGGTGSKTQAGALSSILGASSIPLSNGGTNATTAAGAIANMLAPTTLPILGCDTTGSTDATSCLQTKINTLSVGGRVKVTGKLLISGNLTVPPGVSLEGDCVLPGTVGSNTSTPYGSLACGVLMVSSSATINLSAGASLKSAIVYRAGMTFPAADSSAFAGTAVTVAGDDAAVDHVIIMGFNKAVYVNGYQRPLLNYIYGDNNNGIELTSVYDIARITNCHFWPFSTVAAGGSTSSLQRSGTAYYLHDSVDAPMLVNNFSYGYNVGFRFQNISTVNAVNNMADNTGSYSGSTGWRFDGNLNGFTGVGNSVWSQAVGVLVNLNGSQIVDLSKMSFNTNTTHISVAGGNVKAYEAEFFNSTTLLSVSNASSIVDFDHNTFVNNTNYVTASVATTNVRIGHDNINLSAAAGTSLANSNVKSPTIASADPLPLPPFGDTFIVSGAAGFGNLAGGWAGRKVTLIFTGALTVFSSIGSTNSMFLKGAQNFVTGQNSTLTLVHNGTQWIEVSAQGQTPSLLGQTIVANLPSCSAASLGLMYAVSDATSPAYNSTLTGGGSVAIPAFCNGSSWVAH